MRKQDRIEADRQQKGTQADSEQSQPSSDRLERERMRGRGSEQPVQKERQGGKLPLPE
jgi:hypothetical protein